MNRPVPRNKSLNRQLRKPEYPIDPIFVQRWSPRAYDASSMPVTDLHTIIEAARWAPSAYNIQPWRFIYALRGDEHWETFLQLLDPFNEAWARNASALLFLVSDSLVRTGEPGEHKPSQTHSFDAGAAWAQLALQATASGYQAHAMAGILFNDVASQLRVPEHFRVEIAIAIGRQAPSASLPPALRERETPSSRLPLDQIASAGQFDTGQEN